MEMVVAEELFAGGGEMGALMRSLDWSQTLLGSVSDWAQSLKTAVSIILTSRYPMFIWWGAEYANLYNDAYRPILGASKHPQFLGQSAKDCWADVWDVVGPLADSVLTTGQPTWSEDLLLLMDRNGYLEETYFTFSYSPVRDESGGVGGVFCAVRETTRRIIGERRLRTLRELAAKTAEATTVEEACHIITTTLAINPHDIPFALLYRVEPEGKQAYLAGTTGIEAGTVASPQQVDLFQESEPNGSGEVDRWNLARVNRTGKVELISELPTRFGVLPKGAWSEEPTEALVIPIAQSGKVQRRGLLVVGISPRRKFDDDYQGFFDLIASNVATAIANADAYEVERKRAAALTELDRAKTTFFSNISHEFRTPLTLMLGSVEETLTGNDPLSTHQREQLEVAQRNSLRLLKLVNTLLDFSRIEAGRSQAVYEPTDLATFTRELASVFRSAIERAGMQLIVDCSPLPESIYVDREMWEKIVLNLLSNAFKFTFEGKITVALRSCTDHVELDVRDTGIGIPENELPHLFDRFHRVPGARGRTYEGSGIGLSLVQELVLLHGGTLSVASVEGQGSCFTVSIPVGFVHLPQNQIDATQTLTSTATQAAAYVEEALRWLPEEGNREWGIGNGEERFAPTPYSLLPTPSPARILLVDDNADMRDYVRRLLSCDYEVEVVSNGLAALDAVQRYLPDLVLTDVMMPGLDGLELLRSLRNNPATQNIPIILLSARAGEESRIEGLEAGADDYLVKPFSGRELVARVRTNIELARLRREAVRSEIALRRSEEQLRLAQQAAGAGLWNWDIVADRVTWSEDYYQLYGLDPATTPSYENWIASIWEPDRERVERTAREALEHRTNLNVEFRVFHPIQGLRWLVAIGQTFYDANGKPIRMAGIALDITERKQAEAEVQRREREFRAVVENTPDLIIRYDGSLRHLYVNPSLERALGIPPEQFIGRTAVEMGFTDATSQAWNAALQPVFLTAQDSTFEFEFPNPEGERRSYQAYFVPELVQDNEVKTVLAVVRDVTEYKRAEEALRQSEERYRLALQAGRMVTWGWDAKTDRIVRAQTACDVMGLPAEALQGTSSQGWRLVHPDDLAQHQATVQAAINSKGSYISEFRMIRPDDGTVIWLEDRGKVNVDATGHLISIEGTLFDISDRKQAQQELQQTLQTLSTLINASPLPIVVIKPNLAVQLWNPAAEQLFGWNEAEVVGQPIPIVPEEKRDECRQVREAVAKGEVFASVETYRCKRDGTTVIVSISAAPLYNEQGSLNAILLIFQDITQRQQAEQALRQSEERYRYLAESIPQLVWTANAQGVLLDINQRWLDYTGLTLVQAQIEGWQAIVHPDDVPILSQQWSSAQQNGTYYQAEGRMRRVDGVYRWYLHQAVPLKNERGQAIKWFGTATDIDDQKQLEQQRDRILQREQAAREEAERANRIKDEFLAVLSHELRSPLNPILGWAKLLQSRTFDEQKTKHALATIERNALLQAQLIEDLLDVSRILRGKLVLNAAPVSLASTIEAALETVRLAAEAKGIQIQRVLDPNMGQVMGESARLQQVIWNLLSNAVKFTPSGGTIEIRLEQTNTYAQLQVKDSGKGINPEFLPHVFEYFRQEDGTTTRKFGGLGLGLAIVRHLVELHGGTVWAESLGEGLGATFIVRLPLISAPTETPPGNPPASPVAHLTGLRILVVDDQPDIRDIVAFILEEAGATVSVAASAPQALNLMEQSLPDVLICDIGMPDMDGYMLMRFLRTLPPSQGGKIPAIALTAYAGEVDQQQALAAGFQQHIAKPVEPDELVRAIARLVQHSRST